MNINQPMIERRPVRAFVCAAAMAASIGAAEMVSAQSIFGSMAGPKAGHPNKPASLEVGSSIESELGRGDAKGAFRAAEYFRFSSRPGERIKIQITPKDRPLRVLVRRGSAHGSMAWGPEVIEVGAPLKTLELAPGENYVLAVISKNTGSAGRYAISLFSDERPVRALDVALPVSTSSVASTIVPSSSAEATTAQKADVEPANRTKGAGSSEAGARGQQKRELVFGETETVPGSAKDFELFHFVGASGTAVQIQVSGPGKSIVTLYTPGGEPMVAEEGDDKVTLKAILPLNNIFLVSVVRSAGKAPYKIALNGDEPDPLFSSIVEGIGYQETDQYSTKSSCWIEPGVKFRTNMSDPKGYFNETIIGRDNSEHESYHNDSGIYLTSITTQEISDGVVSMEEKVSNGKHHKYPAAEWAPKYPSKVYKLGRYIGYLCSR